MTAPNNDCFPSMINTNCNGSGSESAGTNSMDQNSNDNHGNMYESKQNRKLVRFVTVIAYMFAVSLAAIVLSLYYFFLWDPCMQQTLSDPVMSNVGGFGGADAYRSGGRKRIASHGHSRPMPAFVQPIAPPPVPSKPFEPYAVSATQQRETLLAMDAISHLQSTSDSNEDTMVNNETEERSPPEMDTHRHTYANQKSATQSAQASEPLPTPLALWLFKRRDSSALTSPTDILLQSESYGQTDGSNSAFNNEHQKKQLQRESAQTNGDEANTVANTMTNTSRIASNNTRQNIALSSPPTQKPMSAAMSNITVIDSATYHEIWDPGDRGIHKLATQTSLETHSSETFSSLTNLMDEPVTGKVLPREKTTASDATFT